jgi:hypothetical protein
MEELFNNFAEHVSKLISPILGNRIKQYLYNKLQEENSPELYNEVENDIKILMTNYFQNATDKDFNDISTNLFNAYVENDDENFIKSVKFFIRTYSYYQDLNLKKKLYRWRINVLKLKMKKNNQNNKISKSKSSSQINNYNNQNPFMNNNYNNNSYNYNNGNNNFYNNNFNNISRDNYNNNYSNNSMNYYNNNYMNNNNYYNDY